MQFRREKVKTKSLPKWEAKAAGQNTLKVIQMLQEAIRAPDRVEYQCAQSRQAGPWGHYVHLVSISSL
jgi:hypothetical protein